MGCKRSSPKLLIMKTIFLFIALLVVLFSSCRPARVLTRYETTEIQTNVKTIPFTLRVPPVFLNRQVLPDSSKGVEFDTLQPSVLETEFCWSRVYWADGLQHDLSQKEARRDTIVQVEYVNTTTTIKEPVEVNKLTWWQKLWIRTGQVFSAAMLLVVLWFLFVKRFRI